MKRILSVLVAVIFIIAWLGFGSACGTDEGGTDVPNGELDNGEGDNGEGDNGEGDNGESDNGESDNGESDNGESDNGESDNGEGDDGEGDNGEGDDGEGDDGEGDEWGEWAPEVCHEVACPGTGQVEYCGSCEQDEDGKWPWQNLHCIGPCDDNPDGFYHDLQPISAGTGKCVRDCYYDGDSGAGNDGCEWDHRCDTLEPRPENCGYDGRECVHEQLQLCHDVCMPIVPNGCDCFGCCELPLADGTTEYRFIGTTADGEATCSLDNLDGCNPCTPSDDCLNECGPCQLCLGRTEVPDHCYGSQEPTDPDDPGDPDDPDDPGEDTIDCTDPDEWDPDYCQCEWWQQPCGLPGQDPCPTGYYCITGCCAEIG